MFEVVIVRVGGNALPSEVVAEEAAPRFLVDDGGWGEDAVEVEEDGLDGWRKRWIFPGHGATLAAGWGVRASAIWSQFEGRK